MYQFIPGYSLTREIHRSARSLVYRGLRDGDRGAVVIKTINKDYPEAQDIERLRREHRLLSSLSLPGVVKALALVPWENNMALVLEDCEAQPLSARREALPLDEFLRLAIACTEVLDRLHQQVVHQAINPHNILWNPLSGEVRFIDFALASEVASDPEQPAALGHLMGSLAYISPEQTGRLNRPVDFRSDFYSLGLTLYQALTGVPAFSADDPMAWVHCHLAQTAAEPHLVTSGVPEALGALVLKLMAKDPEDRYQSAQGLKHDLVECRQRWLKSGAIAAFPLGQADVTTRFEVPRRLYGRHQATLAVLGAFNLAATGQTTLVTVSGQAGIGKSALVAEVSKLFLTRGARFAEGKFDQFHHQLPYAAVAQALDALVRQVVAEPGSSLLQWRMKLLGVLGPNGSIAVDLVPALTLIIGEPAPVIRLNPTEEQNRFLTTIQGLISVFASPERPLVLFIDDMQWSDAPTRVLLTSLCESRIADALLVIGAYRDEEVTADHPLLTTIADFTRLRRVHRVRLEPLDEDTLNQFVADVFHSPPDRTLMLSGVIHRKTGGNPFFAGEFLRSLHQDGLFHFDRTEGRWQWDLEAIRQSPLSDNIVDFVIRRIQRLNLATQVQLRQAACIGNTFELGLLTQVSGLSLSSVVAAMSPAVQAGLIAPLDGELLIGAVQGEALQEDAAEMRCQFVHDRVRQAAYELIPAGDSSAIHLRIGRLLQPYASASESAQQLNAGRTLLSTDAERLELARLNFTAATHARASAAYRSAFDFTLIAQELLPAGAWSEHSELCFELLKLHTSCASLCGEAEAARKGFESLLLHTGEPLDRAEVRSMKATHALFANRMEQAIEEDILALADLGIKLAPVPAMTTVVAELLRSKVTLGRRKAHDLDSARLMSDRKTQLAMKILGDFLVPAYLTGKDSLFATSVLKQVNLSLRHGHSAESASAYSNYGVLLAGLGDFKAAYEFGQLALRLSDKFEVQDVKARMLVLYALFSHSWSQPWETLDGWFKQAVETALHTGDFVFLSFASGYVHMFNPHIDLGTALEARRHYLDLCRQAGHQNPLDAATLSNQLWRCLRGETSGPSSLSSEDFDEDACLQRMTEAHYVSGTAIYHLFKLQAACLDEDWPLAWQVLGRAGAVIKTLVGSPYMVEYCLYGFQAAAQMAARQGPEAPAAWRLLKKFHRQMRGWARHCPANFRSHATLMEAEIARLKGHHDRAPHLYEDAIAEARTLGYTRYEAHAHELAARYYHGLGRDKVADAYTRDARDAYKRWGALVKVRVLETRLQRSAGSRRLELGQLHRFDLGLVPQLVESGILDLATVWKATQALSSEATTEGLLGKLLAMVKESACAQRGLLVLNEGDEQTPRFLVQAESSDTGVVRLLQGESLVRHGALPVDLIAHVIETQESFVLGHASREGAFVSDPYVQARQLKSVLAMPIVHQGQLLGVLYLENNLVSEAFTPERLSVLQILAGQAAVSLQNVRAAERSAYLEAEKSVHDTYAQKLEARVAERTQELKQAYEQLKELERLKTHFLGVVSHELRSPLTAIRGFSELLDDPQSGTLNERQSEFLRQIHQGALQLNRLVEDLLDFAHVEDGAVKLSCLEVDLATKLAETTESLAPLLRERQVNFQLLIPPEPVWALADAGRIRQVVQNLVGNAAKFTPPGGRISVTLTTSDTEVRIAVSDTGIGIASEHLPRLFEKFYQADSTLTRQNNGVGLGLAIAHSIVVAHGGAMGVESTPGEGATFWFTLPFAGQPAAHRA